MGPWNVNLEVGSMGSEEECGPRRTYMRWEGFPCEGSAAEK